MCIVFAELKLNAAARAELREGREVCRVPPWSAVPRTGRRRQCAPDASVAPGRKAHALGRTGATSCTAGGDETREGRPLHPDVARLHWLCSRRSWPGAACARMSLPPSGEPHRLPRVLCPPRWAGRRLTASDVASLPQSAVTRCFSVNHETCRPSRRTGAVALDCSLRGSEMIVDTIFFKCL